MVHLGLPFDDFATHDIASQFLNKFYHLQFRPHLTSTFHDSSDDEGGRDELHAQFVQLPSSLG